MHTPRIALALLAITACVAAADPPATTTPFRSNVKVEVTDQFYIVHSDGIPDHTTGDFPNPHNPNTIKKQNYTFKIPRNPRWSQKITKTPMGPIGVAINGVPFYNPYTAQGTDAAKNEVFDECCGHPDAMGRYHYHIYPKCIHTSFSDKPGEHSPLIGFAFDGYAIYGPLGENGKRPTDLDEYNGHTDSVRGYQYHVTDKFPYIIGGYHGVVETSNTDHGPRDAQGRPLAGGPGGQHQQAQGGNEEGPPPEHGRRRRPPPPRNGDDTQPAPDAGQGKRRPPPPPDGDETRPAPPQGGQGGRRRPPPPREGGQDQAPPPEGRRRPPPPPDGEQPDRDPPPPPPQT
jgi:hypothetical protein